MELKKLLENEEVQKMINERLAAGEVFELISISSKEKMTFGDLKINIT